MNATAILRPFAAMFAAPPDEAFIRTLGAEAWVDLIALAHRHRLVPALHEALSAVGPAATVPAEVRAHAAEIATLNEERNRAIREEIRLAVRALNAAGLEPVLLKGAAALLPGPGAVPGRMVGDIDLLMPAGRGGDAMAALGDAGFHPTSSYPASSHAVADLERPGGPSSIDLHRALLDPPFQHLLPVAEAIGRAAPLDAAEMRGCLLAPCDRALHTLLHAQILSGGYYNRHLNLGAARELALFGDQIKWAEIEAWAGRHRMRPVLDSMLLAAQEAFGMAWPLSTPPNRIAAAHHRRACVVEAAAGRWDTGLGPIAKLRESFAPDRLAAAFGTERGFLPKMMLQLGSLARRHGLRELARRLIAA